MRGAAALLALALAACARDNAPVTTTAPDWVFRAAPPRTSTHAGPPPLLVMVHGIGADEHDLLPLAPHLDPRLYVVSLRAPRPYGPGFAWFDIAWRADGSVEPNVPQAQEALAGLQAWLAAAPARFGTDPRRTYLLGFSQGAMLSLGLLGTAPDGLAGVVALSGRAPDGLFTRTASDAVARVPLFVAHGRYDDVLPVANGQRIRDVFGAVSRDLTYREYAVAHGIAGDEVADVRAWLAAHLDAPVP
jgi:phospholipase/carboxylesterase